MGWRYKALDLRATASGKSVTRPTILYRFLSCMRYTEPGDDQRDVREKRVPVVEHFLLVVGEGAIIGHGILGVQTRHAETLGAVLARKDIVRSAFAIHVALSRDVKYVACASWRITHCEKRARIRTKRVTFDRDVDRFGVVRAVEFGERAERKGVVLG